MLPTPLGNSFSLVGFKVYPIAELIDEIKIVGSFQGLHEFYNISVLNGRLRL